MELKHPRCAGMDISSTDAMVCVRIVPKGKHKAQTELKQWGAKTSDVLALADHLVKKKITTVMMEATGQYWKPFFYVLEAAGLDVMLVNPRLVRQIPGRKTDVADAVWLADLCAHQAVKASFVAPLPIQELKDLTRTRTSLVQMRTQEIQRLQDVLESAAIKLTSSVSSVVGTGGRKMVEGLIKGLTPKQIADGTSRAFKASKEELAEALTGRFTEHHGFLARQHLDLIDRLTEQIALLEKRIDTYFIDDPADEEPGSGEGDPRADLGFKRKLLATIPGINETSAEKILSEIGPDMSVFPTAKHLTSWAGVAPGLDQSAGKSKKAKCQPGCKPLKAALGVAAKTVTRSYQGSFLYARYRRVASRRGHIKALVAVERSILVAIWHILTKGEPYKDLGVDYYKKRKPKLTVHRALADLMAVGKTVTPTGDGTYAIT